MKTTLEKQDIAARLAEWAIRFDVQFDELLSRNRAVSEKLDEAVRYSALLPGKRLRPFLVVETGRLCGATEEDVLPAAMAVECVHAFSLIHDDLPAMDDDDLRRGKPTNHKVYGEAIAVLAGDALLALAFEVLATGARSSKVAAGWVAELAQATGREGMIGGQAVDILSEADPPSAERVARIHESKTSRLIQSACRLGAIAAGAEAGAYRSISEYGLSLGLAFQMADDLLDVTSETEMLGKQTAKDQSSGKQTYPRVVGMGRARELACREVDQAVASLERFDEKADVLRELARFVIERKH